MKSNKIDFLTLHNQGKEWYDQVNDITVNLKNLELVIDSLIKSIGREQTELFLKKILKNPTE